MPKYTYVARDRYGKSSSGAIQASNDAELRHILRSNDLFLTRFKTVGGVAAAEGAQSKKLLDLNKPKIQDIVIATRQLSSMIHAGLPLTESLSIVASQTVKAPLQEAFEDLQRGVSNGQSLSSMMRNHPKIFSNLVVSLVASGETSGTLDAALEFAAIQLDREAVLRQRIKAAMMYPKIVVAAAVGTVSAMLAFVVPVFADVYDQLNSSLPTPTLVLLSVSSFVTNYWWVALLMVVGLVLGYRNLKKSPQGQRWLDQTFLKIPYIGAVWRKLIIARFVQTLAGAMSGGVPIISALMISSSTAGNKVIEEAVNQAAMNVRDGASVAEELTKTEQFPLMVTRMIAAGEASGNIDAMLEEINRFYERDVEYAVEAMGRLMEPVMTVVLGGVVLLLMLALYMPIFNIGEAFKGMNP